MSLDKNRYNDINLYFQDESRFGLMSYMGSCLTARGVRPVINYQHKYASTYLYGSYSPINGDSFVWEINGVSCEIFESYLNAFSQYKPEEYKIIVIDNAAFHSVKNIQVPQNIYLLNIPAYCPELNPCEQIWQYMKTRFKNHLFDDINKLREWLWDSVNSLSQERIRSITSNHHYLNAFNAAFEN
jgi:transposase